MMKKIICLLFVVSLIFSCNLYAQEQEVTFDLNLTVMFTDMTRTEFMNLLINYWIPIALEKSPAELVVHMRDNGQDWRLIFDSRGPKNETDSGS